MRIIKRIFTYTALILTGGIFMMTGCSSNNGSGESSVKDTAQTSAPVQTTTVTTTTFKDPSEYGKVIALTFDDGPAVVTTSQVLDALEKYNVKASFFLVGNNINEGTQDIVARAFDMGCEINSHSQTHSYMNKMTAEDIKAEMEYTDEKIKDITGITPRFFRPPYIAVNDTMFENIDKPFISGVGCNDWDESVTAGTIAERVLANAEDGQIVLLHDMQGNDRTVEALDTIIPGLLEQGYELVTVSELFHAKGIEPQEDDMVYSNVLQTTMY